MLLDSTSYWKIRSLQNEKKAQRQAATAAKKTEKYYKKAYKEIEAELNRFYADAIDGEISRTELWNYLHYQEILDTIRRCCSTIGQQQLSLMDDLLEDIFESTLEINYKEFKKENTLFKPFNQEIASKNVINTNWSGLNYSQRVWKNTNQLAANLENHIQSMIAIGKSPTDIKSQIRKDFNVSYGVADRLVRTESSYVYNTAAIESYKAAGVTEVQFLAASNVRGNNCDCKSNNGKVFPINEAPTLPLHPNCRCTYIPIV